jgi:hypothetical protein
MQAAQDASTKHGHLLMMCLPLIILLPDFSGCAFGVERENREKWKEIRMRPGSK